MAAPQRAVRVPPARPARRQPSSAAAAAERRRRAHRGRVAPGVRVRVERRLEALPRALEDAVARAAPGLAARRAAAHERLVAARAHRAVALKAARARDVDRRVVLAQVGPLELAPARSAELAAAARRGQGRLRTPRRAASSIVRVGPTLRGRVVRLAVERGRGRARLVHRAAADAVEAARDAGPQRLGRRVRASVTRRRDRGGARAEREVVSAREGGPAA